MDRLPGRRPVADASPAARRRRELRRARTMVSRALGLPASRRVVRRRLPGEPEPLADVTLHAVIGTWNEEDVIASTVTNAIAQGCESVLLVDNGSTDGTVEVAARAGAELVDSYTRPQYNEHERLYRMNTAVLNRTLTLGRRSTWWLFLDADEFPHGPDGTTVASYVRGLDRRFRAVGTTTYDHYPTGPVGDLDGRHPIEAIGWCARHDEPYCGQRHHKHPLLRQDWGEAPLFAASGFHTTSAGHRRVAEPAGGLHTHHFPFRDEAATRRRHAALADRLGVYLPSSPRAALLDDVYAGRWEQVRLRRGRLGDTGVRPRPLAEVAPPEHREVLRWPVPAAPPPAPGPVRPLRRPADHP